MHETLNHAKLAYRSVAAWLDGKEGAVLYHTLALAGTPKAEIAALVRETARQERADQKTPTVTHDAPAAVALGAPSWELASVIAMWSWIVWAASMAIASVKIAKASRCPSEDSQYPTRFETPVSVPVLPWQRPWAAVPRPRSWWRKGRCGT